MSKTRVIDSYENNSIIDMYENRKQDIKKELVFPKGFLWGTSTSAYQVEGNINCDWSSSFDAGLSSDNYHLYEKDFDIMQRLNQNSYRFSIEWSRIEPEMGKFDEKEIEHYRKVLQSLKNRGIKTMVTLHHFTDPLWLYDIGGWTNKKIVFYFSRFAIRVLREYGDLVDFWITINEPCIYTAEGYLTKRWPISKIDSDNRILDLYLFLKVVRNQILAHKKVYKIFHREKKNVFVGIAKNNIFFEPVNKKRFLDKICVKISNYFWNFFFLDKIQYYLDFIGLNYYFHKLIKFPFIIGHKGDVLSDMGWEIYPSGIYYVLKNLRKYRLPIYITENGLADSKDIFRKKFIQEHLYWIHKSIEQGIDVRGYFHWSLLDNFEWDLGFNPCFGLIEVNYETLERKIRPSAFFYSEVCRKNSCSLSC